MAGTGKSNGDSGIANLHSFKAIGKRLDKIRCNGRKLFKYTIRVTMIFGQRNGFSHNIRAVFNNGVILARNDNERFSQIRRRKIKPLLTFGPIDHGSNRIHFFGGCGFIKGIPVIILMRFEFDSQMLTQ
jgi:hypothetical protein